MNNNNKIISRQLGRGFLLHMLLSFLLAFIIIFHISEVHNQGSSTKIRIDSKKNITFGKYYWLKDITILFLVLLCLILFISICPNFLGYPDNYIKADLLSTSQHITFEWYLLTYYSLLKSIESKAFCIILMASFFIILIILPLSYSMEKLVLLNPAVEVNIVVYLVLFTLAILLAKLGAASPTVVAITIIFIITYELLLLLVFLDLIKKAVQLYYIINSDNVNIYIIIVILIN